MTAANWCFTLNNYTEQELESVREICDQHDVVKYVCFAQETGAAGTPHLQGYMGYLDPQRLARCKKLIPRAHFQQMRGNMAQNAAYCSKQGKMEVYGNPPEDPGFKEINRWQRAFDSAASGNFEEIPADLRLRYYGLLNRIRDDYATVPAMYEGELHVKNFWIWGPPGTGKSKKAREILAGDFYYKNLNKWWCGFRGGNVLIEEYSPDVRGLESFMKIWCDRYPFRGEMKGGSRQIMPGKVVVTSNYSIDECFAGRDGEAIKRRFTEIYLG